VRDPESYAKLQKWGVDSSKIISSSDPAVLPKPEKLSKSTKEKLQKDFEIDEKFLENFVSIGPRDWFHYKTGGLIPFRYKKAILKTFGKDLSANTAEQLLYKSRLVELVDNIIKEHGFNVLLVPMHMNENDTELCNYIKKHVKKSGKIRILVKDTLSPAETRSLISHAKAAVGFRLHSTIISTSCNVPSINIFYVDKGRAFFDQIDQSRFALPIEKVLDDNFEQEFTQLFSKLIKEHSTIAKELELKIEELRNSVTSAVQQVSVGNE
jgi:polysaccharide pyruvyl transferase WcaK-like protein